MTITKTLTSTLLALSLLAGASGAHATEPKVVSDRILVQLPGLDSRDAVLEAVENLSGTAGVSLSLERSSILDWYVLKVEADHPMDKTELEPLVLQIQEERDVSRITLDRIIQPLTNFNDPLLPQQAAVDILGLRQAWDVSTGDPNLVVAIVDTGIVPHEDLDAAFVGGYDIAR